MNTTNRTVDKKIEAILAIFFIFVLGIMATGCGGGSSTSDGGIINPPPSIEAPGTPTNFTIDDTIGQILSATLSWGEPSNGGEVASYEIYRSTTPGTVFNPDNHLISLSPTTFEFIDNSGLIRNEDTYWVVAAKNAGGETPTNEVLYVPSGGAGGEVVGFGNNFSSALIFADGYGISGLQIEGNWTKTVDNIDHNTGLRPTTDQVLPEGTELPYLDPTTTHELDGITYYKQKTASTWQGEWKVGTEELQDEVTAAWGDNLVSQTLTTESIVRIEMVLTKALDTNMTSYNMVSLYGEKYNEVYGTDGTEYNNTKAFVFATNARLTINALDAEGNLGEILENQPLFSEIPDGPGKFGAEINVAGNLTYGYVWDLKKNEVPSGKYRITFSLDETSAGTGTSNNTSIWNSPNGVVDSNTSVHIDITIN